MNATPWSPRTGHPSSAAMLVIALAASFLAVSGRAQSVADGPRSRVPGPLLLTLDQALALGAEKNRDVQKALEYQRWAQGKYVAERAGALPELTLNADVSRNRDESQEKLLAGIPAELAPLFSFEQDRRGAEVGMSQALYAGGGVGAAIRAAKAGIASAADQLRSFRQAAARDITAAFYDVILAKEMTAIAAQNLDQKRRHHEEAVRKRLAGAATDYDVLAAEVAVENAQPEAIRTENLERVARDRLRFLLAEEREVDVSGGLDAAVAAYPEFDAVLAAALAHRPELGDIGHRRAAAAEQVKVSSAADKPRLDLRAGYGYRVLEVGDLGSEGTTWRAGLYASFPFFDGLRTRGRVAQARSELAATAIEEAKLRDAIALEVRTAVNAVRESGEIVEALSGTVAQAEKLLDMAEKAYEYGAETHLEVQDAQLNLLTARGNLARATRDYRVAQVTLEWATGTLGEAGWPDWSAP